jgi:hypothetical protein
MSNKIKDVTVIVGTYTNAQGQEKRRYKTIGAIYQTKTGQQLKIDQFPIVEGGWNGWAYLNDPKPTEAEPAPTKSQSASRQNFSDLEDDIPFN